MSWRAGPLHQFRDWPNDQVPKRAAGVYTVWDGDRLVYVGMSGRAMTADHLEVSPGGRAVAKGLRTRLNAHASGRRSGDQFCVYVCDRFVVPALTPSQLQQLAAGSLSLDGLTRTFVHDRLGYRYVVTADGDNTTTGRAATKRLRPGTGRCQGHHPDIRGGGHAQSVDTGRASLIRRPSPGHHRCSRPYFDQCCSRSRSSARSNARTLARISRSSWSEAMSTA
jgi:hypothetical protein